MQIAYIQTKKKEAKRKMSTPVIIGGCGGSSRQNSFDVSHLEPTTDFEQNPEGHNSRSSVQEEGELERLRREKISAVFTIDKYKRFVTYAVIFGLTSAILSFSMVSWKFMEQEPSLRELRSRLINTPEERPRICVSAYPNLVNKRRDKKVVGEALFLTPLIREGKLEEARDKARVTNIMQTENLKKVNGCKNRGSESPLLLWLQGGPGWPSLYGLFKENGPFLVGWDYQSRQSYLIKNRHSWHRNHNLLYIDNPVGTGFSFAESNQGYCRTDEEVAEALLEVLRQFMILYPYFVPESDPKTTRFFAFGESYGGSYVVSLAHKYLEYKDNNSPIIENLQLAGVGIGSGFISPEDQALYADYVNSIGYVTEREMYILKENDRSILRALKEKRYADASGYSQRSLAYVVNYVMNMTNLYDYTLDSNYLTNNEYVCFVDQNHVRKGINVGDAEIHEGKLSLKFLNDSIMVSKKSKLERTLDRGIEVLIYNGNFDLIVHISGTNKMINSLNFNGRKEFLNSERKEFWVWNTENERGELAGYITSGGGLFYAVMRNAGHMVPISQPLRTQTLVTQFTHADNKYTDRFAVPVEMEQTAPTLKSIKDIEC